MNRLTFFSWRKWIAFPTFSILLILSLPLPAWPIFSPDRTCNQYHTKYGLLWWWWPEYNVWNIKIFIRQRWLLGEKITLCNLESVVTEYNVRVSGNPPYHIYNLQNMHIIILTSSSLMSRRPSLRSVKRSPTLCPACNDRKTINKLATPPL